METLHWSGVSEGLQRGGACHRSRCVQLEKWHNSEHSDKIDFKQGTDVRKLSLAGKPDTVGDQTANFEQSVPFKFLAPEPK